MRKFKLQTVLDHRKRLMDHAQRELQQCIEDRSALAVIKEREEAEMLWFYEELQEAKEQMVDIREIVFCEDAILFKKRFLLEIENKIRAADAMVARKNLQLVKARQEKRVLEILKEKKEKESVEKQKRHEMLCMDEVAVLRFGGRNEKD